MFFDAESYDFNAGLSLPAYTQEKLLNHMKQVYNTCKQRIKGVPFDENYLQNLSVAQRELDELYTVLDILGIKIAYDWVGHRKEFFFPTYQDALAQEDWFFQCAD